jgi:glycosyltransferase involved in cell wall biosynthesis
MMTNMEAASPRVVIGAPLFEKADYLPGALDSLLAQSYRDFALILVDDASGDRTPEVAESYAARDRRAAFRRNPERLGMIGNKRRCFQLARELYPGCSYFAWGSDHDFWHPRWLKALVAALDAHPEAVLAYPLSVRIEASGEVVRGPWTFDTLGEKRASLRVRRTTRRAASGSMVYGLYRADALEQAGVFRYVLNPDRLLMLELALQGQFVQVPEVLWERRFRGLASHARQREAFFPGGAPLSMRIPSWLVHVGVFLRTYVVRGSAQGRWTGLAATSGLLVSTIVQLVLRRIRLVRKWGLKIKNSVYFWKERRAGREVPVQSRTSRRS